ncbi:MAG TPA: ABC transporter ATP-binding protein [Fibrobacteres bacterium]|nr:ABC transporter ATP-binding protein [Fibrobacterota bacterium]
MSNPILSVRGLTKSYQMGETTVHALRGVDFDIYPSEFLAISGPSGSGKSTLMNILGCLDLPTSGKYLLDGHEVQSLDRDALSRLRNRNLGFVFQSFNLLPRTTALENVELPLLYRHDISSAEIREHAMQALAAVGLAERAGHYPNQLSGGQQQRVAIARSMVNDPVLILADEPTGSLDSKSSEQVFLLLRDLAKRGKTIVAVTHDLDLAGRMDRRIQLVDGAIVSDAPNPNPER